jgi:hypothetical protein
MKCEAARAATRGTRCGAEAAAALPPAAAAGAWAHPALALVASTSCGTALAAEGERIPLCCCHLGRKLVGGADEIRWGLGSTGRAGT